MDSKAIMDRHNGDEENKKVWEELTAPSSRHVVLCGEASKTTQPSHFCPQFPLGLIPIRTFATFEILTY